MNHLWIRASTMTIVLVAVAALGCGGGDGGADMGEAGGEGAEAAGPVVPPDSAATVTGRVTFEGVAPEAEAIDMSEEPTCAEQYAEPPMRQPVTVTDGMLANVYVYVKEGLGERSFPTPSEGVSLDQQGCRYHPHVVAIQVGQPLIIKNSDGILHNINTQPTTNRGFNISQPIEMETTRDFSLAEVMIPVKCDVHGWMEAFIGVQEHPYAAVSGDDGTFSLENMPPGEYVIEAWHEVYGTQTQTVAVGPKESAEISFSFSSEMAGADVPMGEPIDLHDHGEEPVVETASAR